MIEITFKSGSVKCLEYYFIRNGFIYYSEGKNECPVHSLMTNIVKIKKKTSDLTLKELLELKATIIRHKYARKTSITIVSIDNVNYSLDDFIDITKLVVNNYE